jgi:hypothetical protein
MSAQFTLFFVAAIKVMSLWVVWMKLTPAKEMIGVSLESLVATILLQKFVISARLKTD